MREKKLQLNIMLERLIIVMNIYILKLNWDAKAVFFQSYVTNLQQNQRYIFFKQWLDERVFENKDAMQLVLWNLSFIFLSCKYNGLQLHWKADVAFFHK